MPNNMFTLVNTLHNTPLYRQLIPAENVGTGWPIPLRRQGKVYVTLPFFGQVYDRQTKQTQLSPPFALITLDWSQQRPVEYVDLRFRHPWTETTPEGYIGTFPHPALSSLNTQQYEHLRLQLFSQYDELMEALLHQTTLSDAWDNAFRMLLRQLVEPALEPYYRSLGPKFFAHFLVQETSSASVVS